MPNENETQQQDAAQSPSPTYTPDLRGFVAKYNVYRRNEDGSDGELIEGPTFTLRPYDPIARLALIAYAYGIEDTNGDLSNDLIALAAEYAKGNAAEPLQFASILAEASASLSRIGLELVSELLDSIASGEFTISAANRETSNTEPQP